MRNRFDYVVRGIGENALGPLGTTATQDPPLQHMLGQSRAEIRQQEFMIAMVTSWEEGKAKARAETRAEDLLMVLRVRGFAMPDTARERILAQRDLEQLKRWLETAAVASSLQEVVGDLDRSDASREVGAALELTPRQQEFMAFLEKISEQGRARGRIEARAEDLLTVLRVREIAVPDAAREFILAQRDPVLLRYWLEEAAIASSLREVIGDLRRSGPHGRPALELTPDERAFVTVMNEAREREYAQARIEARAEDLLMVLHVRGVAVPHTARELILAQRDPEQLKRWLETAASASCLRDVLGDLH